MCDILHARQVKAYLRFDTFFNLTNVKKQQEKLLAIIHGLTKRVCFLCAKLMRQKFNRIFFFLTRKKGDQGEKGLIRKEFE